MRNLNKKKFLFCYPHTLTIGLEAPVYRGFSGEGKGEGVRGESVERWQIQLLLHKLILIKRHNLYIMFQTSFRNMYFL